MIDKDYCEWLKTGIEKRLRSLALAESRGIEDTAASLLGTLPTELRPTGVTFNEGVWEYQGPRVWVDHPELDAEGEIGFPIDHILDCLCPFELECFKEWSKEKFGEDVFATIEVVNSLFAYAESHPYLSLSDIKLGEQK